jgi:hypothetical protein
MPNNVTHRLTISGNEQVKKYLIDSIGTDYPEQHNTTHDGQKIYKHTTKEHTYGWLAKNDDFSERDEKGKIYISGKGVPKDFLPDIDPAGRIYIDFNKIIPRPPFILSGNLTMGEQANNPGRNWLDWNTKHWGTKWNAYSTKLDDQQRIIFETAWSFPEPILLELSTLFPELKLTVETIDEGDCFWGTAEFLAGNMVKNTIVRYRDAIEEHKLEKKRLNKELRGIDEDKEEN